MITAFLLFLGAIYCVSLWNERNIERALDGGPILTCGGVALAFLLSGVIAITLIAMAGMVMGVQP